MKRTLKRIGLGLLLVVILATAGVWFSLDKETRGLLATVPTNRNILFWSQSQRDAAFRAMDRIPLLAKWHTIVPGASPRPLPPGPPLKLPLDVGAYMAGQRSAALLVVLMSPDYLASQWCADERDWWLERQAALGLPHEERIAVVRIWPTDTPASIQPFASGTNFGRCCRLAGSTSTPNASSKTRIHSPCDAGTTASSA